MKKTQQEIEELYEDLEQAKTKLANLRETSGGLSIELTVLADYIQAVNEEIQQSLSDNEE